MRAESPKETQLWRQKQQMGLEEAAAEKKTRRQSSREPGSFTEGTAGNTQILAGLPNRNRLFSCLAHWYKAGDQLILAGWVR